MFNILPGIMVVSRESLIRLEVEFMPCIQQLAVVASSVTNIVQLRSCACDVTKRGAFAAAGKESASG